MKERATFPKDIYENGKFFFEAPATYDEKASKKAWNEETSAILGELSTLFESTEFVAETLKQTMHDFAENKRVRNGKSNDAASFISGRRTEGTGRSGHPGNHWKKRKVSPE